MLRLMATSAALAIASAPAFAGGVVPQPQPPVIPVTPEVSDWTGVYGGLEYAYVRGDYDGDVDDGTFAAVFLGYMYDFGSYVLGAEIAVSGATDWGVGGEFEGDGDQFNTLRLRAGYDAGAFLPYVTLGVNSSFYDTGEGMLYGMGIGVDYALSDNIRIGLEANYQNNDDYEGVNYNLTSISLRLAYAF